MLGCYHLFTDNISCLIETEREAIKEYKKWCKEFDDVRLYYVTEFSEEFIDGKGGFPI